MKTNIAKNAKLRIFMCLSILFLLPGCYKTANYKREIYATDMNTFQYKGRELSISGQFDKNKCKVYIDLLPQKIYGYKKISSSGPYKIKIYYEQYGCENYLKISKINVYADKNGEEKIYGKAGLYEFLKNRNLGLNYFISNETFKVNYESDKPVFVEIELIREDKGEFKYIYKLNPKLETGEVKIPIIST